MYRGDIKMIKNTEIQYTAREAKLIAKILDAARSEFYKDEAERSGSFDTSPNQMSSASALLSSSYYSSKVTSLALIHPHRGR
jgi:hypothetical protein